MCLKVTALLGDIEEMKMSQMSSVDLRIEVADINTQEAEEHESKCKVLAGRVEDLEAKCEELVAKALAGDKAMEELLKEQAAYRELEDTCFELRNQLRSLEDCDTSSQDVSAMRGEMTTLRDQNARQSKEKGDLDLLCSNLMEELDEKHNTAAVSILLDRTGGIS